MNQIKKFLLIELIVGLLSVLAAGCATEPTPSTRTAHLVTRQGVKVFTGKYATFRGLGCLNAPPVDINIVTPPQHGKVIVESESVKIETLSSGNPHCIGNSVTGKVVYYISDSNYIGEERFSYTVSAPQVPYSATNWSITVKVSP